jgi:DNA topoisomerase I
VTGSSPQRVESGTLAAADRAVPSTQTPAALPSAPPAAARTAGLRYVSDAMPGMTREMGALGWVFRAPDGSRITDEAEVARILKLGIPPAWTDVWICPFPKRHLQATGRDARGRKQYRYHPRWREVRDQTKYHRIIAFAEALPAIRARTETDLARPGLPREKVLATVVQLLEKTLIRVGNDAYARANQSFGLTTMRNRHVTVDGATVTFEFRGKSGKVHAIDLRDRRLARIVRQCRELPGYELFQYVDEGGQRQVIDSADVNDYLREITGEDFTAKDFRTWFGTVLAARALQAFEAGGAAGEAKKNLAQAIEAVAKLLGNTRAICRKCYVHPAIVDAYLEGSLIDTMRQRADAALQDAAGLQDDAKAVLRFLKRRALARRRS